MKKFFVIFSLAFVASCSGTRPTDSLTQDGTLSACPDKPNCVSSEMSDSHHISPFIIKGKPAPAWAALRTALSNLERTEIITISNNYIHAESTSLIFRFVDDMEFVLRTEKKRIDLRSASRIGYGDLDVNRNRIESIRKTLQKNGVIE